VDYTVMLLQQSKEHLSVECTCNTYFGLCNLFRSIWSMLSYDIWSPNLSCYLLIDVIL